MHRPVPRFPRPASLIDIAMARASSCPRRPRDGTVPRAVPGCLKETHLEPPPLRVMSKPPKPAFWRKKRASLLRAAVNVGLDPGPPHFGNHLCIHRRRPTGSAQLLEWRECLRKLSPPRVKGAPLAGLSSGSAMSSLWLWTGVPDL